MNSLTLGNAKQSLALFVVLIIGAIIISCGNSRTKIKGDVFVSTNSEQVLKPAAITVKIIKKEKYQGEITTFDYFATTDADGKFEVSIPNGEYIAAADFTRNEAEKFHTHYSWRVPFTARGGEAKISLNTSNAQAKTTIDR